MKTLNVLLAVRPKLLAEVIRNMIERQPDMHVVGEKLDLIELLLVPLTTSVDVVIIAPLDAAEKPRICRHLLAEYPLLKIITLAEKNNTAVLYASGGVNKHLNESSEASILSAIRASTNQT